MENMICPCCRSNNTYNFNFTRFEMKWTDPQGWVPNPHPYYITLEYVCHNCGNSFATYKEEEKQ